MGNEHDAFIFVLYRVGLWDFLDHFFNMVVLYLGILILHLKCKCKSWTQSFCVVRVSLHANFYSFYRFQRIYTITIEIEKTGGKPPPNSIYENYIDNIQYNTLGMQIRRSKIDLDILSCIQHRLQKQTHITIL